MLIFGPFRLDRYNEQLWREQEQRRLTPKAFTVLCCLVEHVGQLMTKEALLEAVWPNTYVSEAALVVCIREIRQALGDRSRAPQYIETIYRRGYRFIAPVTTSEPDSCHQNESELDPKPMIGWEAELASDHQIGLIEAETRIGKTTPVAAVIVRVETDVLLRIGHGQLVLVCYQLQESACAPRETTG